MHSQIRADMLVVWDGKCPTSEGEKVKNPTKHRQQKTRKRHEVERRWARIARQVGLESADNSAEAMGQIHLALSPVQRNQQVPWENVGSVK